MVGEDHLDLICPLPGRPFFPGKLLVLQDPMETLLTNVINGLCVFKFNGVFKYCHLVLHSMFVRANHLLLSETLSFDFAKSCLFLIPLKFLVL